VGAPVGGAVLTWRQLDDAWTSAVVEHGCATLHLLASTDGSYEVSLSARGHAARIAKAYVDAPPALLLARAQAAAVTAARAFVAGLGAGLRDEPASMAGIAGLVTIALTDQLVHDGHTLLVAQRDQQIVRKSFLDVVGRLAVASWLVIDADTLDGASHAELLDTIGRPLIHHAAQAIVDEVQAHTRVQDAIENLGDVAPR
jgi:hypothetical protein